MTSADILHRLNLLTGRRDEVLASHSKAVGRLAELELLRKDIEESQVIIQRVAQDTQDQLEYRISELASYAMDAIFPRPYKMKVHFEAKRGKTECSLLFGIPGSDEEQDPLDSTGYGVVDVASFALRLTALEIQRPRRRNIIILDEPFKFVSKDLLPRVSDMLHQLVEKLGIQFIIVTHESGLIREGDTVFNVQIKDEVSTVSCSGETISSDQDTREPTPELEELEW
jgi:hypothetical protein